MSAVRLVRPTGELPRGVRMGFTTRHGGVTPCPRGPLTLAAADDVPSGQLQENWRRALRALDPRTRLQDAVLMSQVHGGDVAVARRGLGVLQTIGEVDAVVTAERGVALAVRVADCVPILFASPTAVGAAHAGWRGVAANIAPRTVEALVALGALREELVAVIGPHISAAAYEVGGEVIAGVAASGVPRSVVAVKGPRREHADLGASVRWQLEQCGVRDVRFAGSCTTGPDYFSWRADGSATGRQAGLVVRW